MAIIFNDPNQPGKKLSASRLNQIERNQEQLSRLSIHGGGQGSAAVTNASGTHIYIAPAAAQTTTKETTGSVILEYHMVWSASTKYRLNERCTYKPNGSDWYYVYECTDTTAASGDIPNASTKWNCLTHTGTMWASGTTYASGVTGIMWGTPGQYKLYTSTVTGNHGNDPLTSPDKWTATADVLLGLPASWPLVYNGNKIYTPYRKYVPLTHYYDKTTHNLIYYYSIEVYDKNGKRLSDTVAQNYVLVATAKSC